MSWINWHEPAITAAQAAWAIGGVIVLNVVISLWQGLFGRSPVPVRVEEDQEIVGDGSTLGRELL